MSDDNLYDVVIIGGGLAGLSSAILLSRKKYKVLLLEKESYPKHKVCGEYISMESRPFLLDLGVPLDDMHLPVINKLQLTDNNGNELNEDLPQGGFGIGRYLLDATLAILAVNAGTKLLTKSKAEDVTFSQNVFKVKSNNKTYSAKVVCGAWGKRGNIDINWERSFLKERNKMLNNYIGIKYHIKYPWPQDLIGLHNFTDGYCGITQIEEDKCCLCYLTTAANLRRNSNDIKKMEQEVLMKNPWLEKIFRDAEFLFDTPIAISQISFDKKEQVYDHVLLLGDSAGMITPLCGNGMSMAFHSAKIAVGVVDGFLSGTISRDKMEKYYKYAWKRMFSKRLTLGRIVQTNFGKDRITSFFIKAMKLLPFLRKVLINGTSGKPF